MSGNDRLALCVFSIRVDVISESYPLRGFYWWRDHRVREKLRVCTTSTLQSLRGASARTSMHGRPAEMRFP